MKANQLTKLFNEGLNYLNFYDMIYMASESNLLNSIDNQELLVRLNNSIVDALLSLEDDTTIYAELRSASYFFRNAEDMVNQSGQSILEWKDMSIEDVRTSILNAIISYEKYIIYAGIYSLVGVSNDGKLQNLSADFLRAQFPNDTKEDIEALLDLYLDYIETIDDFELYEEIIGTDYESSGGKVLEYVDDDDYEIDLNDLETKETSVSTAPSRPELDWSK